MTKHNNTAVAHAWRGSSSLTYACQQAITRITDLYPNTRKESGLAREVMGVLCSEFPDTKISGGPPEGPALTLDGTPIQVSVRMGREKSDTDVRWSMDAAPGILGKSATARRRRWASCLRIARRLKQQYGADSSIFERLVEILAPEASQMGFGSRFPTGNQPRFQFYVGTLGAGGRQRLYESTATLGVRDFADKLFPLLGDTDTIIPAIDLIPGTKARAKLYVFLSSYDVGHFESFRRVAGEFWPIDDLETLFHDLYCQTPEVPQGGAGPLLTFHLNAGVVTGVALDLSTSPFDLELADGRFLSDGEVYDHAQPIFKRLGISSDPYRKALKAYALTKLADEAGINERLAFLRDRDGMAITTYLSPRFFAHRFGFRVGVPTKPTPEPKVTTRPTKKSRR